jgi:hypothetical protein
MSGSPESLPAVGSVWRNRESCRHVRVVEAIGPGNVTYDTTSPPRLRSTSPLAYFKQAYRLVSDVPPGEEIDHG